MKTKPTLALLSVLGVLLFTIQGSAQLTAVSPAQSTDSQLSGVSHPETLPDTTSTTADDPSLIKPAPAYTIEPASPATKPVAMPRMDIKATAELNPLQSAYIPASPMAVQTASVRQLNPVMTVTDDINGAIVPDESLGPNQLPAGTVLRACLQNPISTESTAAGSRFTAVLTADATRKDAILLPAGSVIAGRVTRIRPGHALAGPAAIHLQPETINLPDGTSYHLSAEVVDLDNFKGSHVSSENTVLPNSEAKQTLAALGLTTASAAVAGALVGAGVGAVVGAGVGVGVGTVWWLKRDREQVLIRGTSILFGLENSMQLTPVNP